MCLRLLAKEPDERLSARELGLELDRIMHGDTPVSPKAAPVERRRNLGAFVGFGLFALGLGLGGGRKWKKLIILIKCCLDGRVNKPLALAIACVSNSSTVGNILFLLVLDVHALWGTGPQ